LRGITGIALFIYVILVIVSALLGITVMSKQMDIINFYYISILVVLGKSTPYYLKDNRWLVVPGLFSWVASSMLFDRLTSQVSFTEALVRFMIEAIITFLVLSKVFFELEKSARLMPAFIVLTGANTASWIFGSSVFMLTGSILFTFITTALILFLAYMNTFIKTLEIPPYKAFPPTFLMIFSINILGMANYAFFIK
jgi:hypothetical protein